MGRMIGIDLGTTSSCVAAMEGGVPQVIPNQENERTTPSVVGFAPDGQRLVGRPAKLQASLNPGATVFGVKRLIGRKFDSPECEAFRRFAPFKVVPAPNGDAHVEAAGRVYSPPELCALVLAKLKAAAEDYLGEAVEEALITVPAYFDDPQRQATKDAGLIAGLEVSRIINEPTAAALAYGLGSSDEPGLFVAVYDLGGGTFDITILEMTEGLFQVRATGGNTFLGGDDFDERIMKWLLSECWREAGMDVQRTPELLVRLRESAEKFKRVLSSAEEVEVVAPFLTGDSSWAGQLSTALSRRQYEALTQDLLQQTAETCERCLADAKMRPEQIDEVLLVGGQSRAPGVVSIVRQIFGREPNLCVHPYEGVAIGAAIQTGIIQGNVKDLVLLDVTPHTLGIETQDGTFTPLIERNCTIPTRKARVFTTAGDNQTRVKVHVLQGECETGAYNKSLAKFELTNIPPAPRGVPQIEVSFAIDVNGIVSVEATDQATGLRQAMTIHSSGGLNQADIGRMAAETHARQRAEQQHRENEKLTWPTNAPPAVAAFWRRVRARGIDAGQGLWLEVGGESYECFSIEAIDAGTCSVEVLTRAPVLGGDFCLLKAAEATFRAVVAGVGEEPRLSLAGGPAELKGPRPCPVKIPLRLLAANLDPDKLPRPGRKGEAAKAEQIPSGAVASRVPSGRPTPRGRGEPVLSEEERQQIEKVSAAQHIYRINTKEKLITALKGSREERAILIRDPNRLVALAVLGSPKVTEAEVDAFSAMRDVSDQVLREIGNHREWTKRYAVINNLVRNPRTPVSLALNLVPRLGPRDLEDIAVDPNVAEALRRLARKVAETHRRGHEAQACADRAAVQRQLGGLVAHTLRSVQALEDKLSTDERQRILGAIEAAKKIKGRPKASLEDLQNALKEMETAAAILGQAMPRR